MLFLLQATWGKRNEYCADSIGHLYIVMLQAVRSLSESIPQEGSPGADDSTADLFQRIAMDIVGPLPRSSSGNRYVLVLCDYATRYPEAVPLRSIDAERIAEGH